MRGQAEDRLVAGLVSSPESKSVFCGESSATNRLNHNTAGTVAKRKKKTLYVCELATLTPTL
jgi:hypothetical protein